LSLFQKKSVNRSTTPHLMVAGAFQPVDHARARNVGCDGVLVKPFEPQLVISRVRELLAAGRSAVATPAATSGNARDVEGTSERPDSPSGSEGEGDYLDRLDAAFAAMSTSHRPFVTPVKSAAAGVEEAASEGRWTPQIVTNSGQPVHQAGAPAPAQADNAGSVYQGTSTSPSLSDAFGALLAAERGKGSPASPPLPPVALSDATIDEIARRVIARLGDEPMRRAVLDAAERLVREEIDRIKKVQQHSTDRG
jgi:hypothetical protein